MAINTVNVYAPFLYLTPTPPLGDRGIKFYPCAPVHMSVNFLGLCFFTDMIFVWSIIRVCCPMSHFIRSGLFLLPVETLMLLNLPHRFLGLCLFDLFLFGLKHYHGELYCVSPFCVCHMSTSCLLEQGHPSPMDTFSLCFN